MDGQEQQCIPDHAVLVGFDGVEKMSKSKDNYIGLTEPASEIFGKVMSISDELMWNYYELLRSPPVADIAAVKTKCESKQMNPASDAKVALAIEIAARFTSAGRCRACVRRIEARKTGAAPEQMPEVTIHWCRGRDAGDANRQTGRPGRQHRRSRPPDRRSRASTAMGEVIEDRHVKLAEGNLT